jgi:methyl-accepting chemotaxis protein
MPFRLNRSLAWKILLPVPVALIIAIAAIWIFVPSMIAENVRTDATTNAQKIAGQFKTIRGYYTKNVIKKVVADGSLKPSYNHKTEEKSVPLPATFIHDISQLLAKEDTTVNLYSAYPFPVRGDRKLDPFQSEAWTFLNQNPDGVFSKQEARDGQEWIRVAVADKMIAQGCVNCHNSHAASPKTDWKLGDVRGVLEVASMLGPQLAAGTSFSNKLVIAGALGGLVLIFVCIVAVRTITGPINTITGLMTRLAENDLDVEIAGADRADEIGNIARAVQVFKENAIQVRELQEKSAEQSRQAEEQKRQTMRDLADQFSDRISSIVNTVSSAATELQSTAGSMSSTTDATNRQAKVVSTAAERASDNVQAVASAAEEMSVSISEINRQVNQSTTIVGRANDEAMKTNETIQGLASAAAKIDEVLTLITEIAEKTNLLALNATIEAARAGEAGKGFAVVASEVKNLATQTARATEEISTQITGMQTSTKESVDAIESIGATIGEINEIAEAIASSVSEQGQATQEIADNTQQAAQGTQEVSSNITSVTDAASETGNAAQDVLTAAAELSQQSESLRQEIDTFLSEIRAA